MGDIKGMRTRANSKNKAQRQRDKKKDDSQEEK
jgi:hypothetical protein